MSLLVIVFLNLYSKYILNVFFPYNIFQMIEVSTNIIYDSTTIFKQHQYLYKLINNERNVSKNNPRAIVSLL